MGSLRAQVESLQAQVRSAQEAAGAAKSEVLPPRTALAGFQPCCRPPSGCKQGSFGRLMCGVVQLCGVARLQAAEVAAARDKLLVTMRKMKAGAERNIKERQAALEAAEGRAAQLAAEGAALRTRLQVCQCR
jgi:hypothetical protein